MQSAGGLLLAPLFCFALLGCVKRFDYKANRNFRPGELRRLVPQESPPLTGSVLEKHRTSGTIACQTISKLLINPGTRTCNSPSYSTRKVAPQLAKL